MTQLGQGTISQRPLLADRVMNLSKFKNAGLFPGVLPAHGKQPGRVFAAQGAGCGLGRNCPEEPGVLACPQAAPVQHGLRSSTEQRWLVGQILLASVPLEQSHAVVFLPC